MAEEQEMTLGQALLGIIVIILMIGMFIHSPNSDSSDSETTQQITQNPEIRQRQLKITNDFVLEAKKNGLIVKIDKMCNEGECIFTFWINENIYNQYGYEDKQGIQTLIMEYGKLRGEGSIARGYYSGKHL